MNYQSQRDQYCEKNSSPLSEVLSLIRKETYFKAEMPQMQLGWIEAHLLKWLIRLTQASQILEIGTFTGLSALAMAEEIPDDGKVITLDRDPKHSAMAKEWWARSPHNPKIELKVGNALEQIQELKKIQNKQFDLIFIDADKENYLNYFHETYDLLKVGGLWVSDNVLWADRVLNCDESSDKQTKALVHFVQTLNQDKRLKQLMLPLGDGLLINQKIS